MATIPGTIFFTSPIAPPSDDSNFGSHYSKYGIGGLQQWDTLTERDNIPIGRLITGSIVYVKDQDQYYKWNGNWITLNSLNSSVDYGLRIPSPFLITDASIPTQYSTIQHVNNNLEIIGSNIIGGTNQFVLDDTVLTFSNSTVEKSISLNASNNIQITGDLDVTSDINATYVNSYGYKINNINEQINQVIKSISINISATSTNITLNSSQNWNGDIKYPAIIQVYKRTGTSPNYEYELLNSLTIKVKKSTYISEIYIDGLVNGCQYDVSIISSFG